MESRSEVFGIKFDNISLKNLGEYILDGRCSGKIVVTPNVDHIVRFHSDPVFRDIYNQANVFVNDSRVLKLLSSLGLEKIKTLVPGSDLTAWLFGNIKEDVKVTVIGSSVETIEIVKTKYDVKNLYHYNPPMGFIDNDYEVDKCLRFCEEHVSDLYFFALGSPRQEVLAAKLQHRGSQGAFLCIGASILFLSGEERRAPVFIQKMHFEWLYRLIQDPKRLYKRYLVDGIKIFPLYIKELLK